MNIEVMKYIPIVGDKHFAVVLVRLEKRYLVAYKVAMREDGGMWISTASTKVGSSNGKDHYMEAFRSDSSFENEEIRNFIFEEVEKMRNQVHPSKSVFSQQANQQPMPHWQQNQNPVQNGYTERQMPQQQNGFNQGNISQNQSKSSDYFL